MATKKSILNDEENPRELNAAYFYAHLGENGGKVFKVKAYPISDKESKVKKSTLKAYSLDEISVTSVVTDKKPGYIVVNGMIDIPLARLEGDSEIFYDRDEAFEVVTRLNKVEWEHAKEIKDEAIAAEAYLQEIVENNRF